MASYRSGGILHVPRRPGTAAFCFSVSACVRRGLARRRVVADRRDEVRRDAYLGRLLERIGEADQRRLVPAAADEGDAERERPDVACRHRDVGIAGDRCRARRPDERREVAAEVTVDRVGDPGRAVGRGDDRVEVVRGERVVDRRLGDRRCRRASRGACRVASAAGRLGEVEDQRVPVGLRRAGLELGMVVVEVDQVLERLRVAGVGVGLEVRRDVGLELAEQGRELRALARARSGCWCCRSTVAPAASSAAIVSLIIASTRG